MYRKNTAGQFICVQLLLTATGAVATACTPAARRCIDGTFAAGGGTFTEDGTTGSYKYALAQADTNGNDISIIVTGTGAIPVCVNFVTTAGDPTDSVRFGLTGLANAVPGATGGLFIAGTNAATVVTTSLTTTFTGNLTGSVASVTGAVGSVTGNVGGNVTGSVGSVTGAVGSVTGAVGSVGAGGIASTTFAAGAINAAAIAADAITDAKVASDVTIASVTGAVGSVTGAVGSVTGAVGSVTGFTAANVATIMAKTDSLTFTVAGVVDANIQRVNDVTVNGTGAVGNEWGP